MRIGHNNPPTPTGQTVLNFGTYNLSIIPPFVMGDEGLSPQSKIIYGLLLTALFQGGMGEGRYWTSQMLSDAIRVPVERVAQLLDNLTQKGLAAIDQKGPDQPVFWVAKHDQKTDDFEKSVLRLIRSKTEGLRDCKSEKNNIQSETRGPKDPEDLYSDPAPKPFALNTIGARVRQSLPPSAARPSQEAEPAEDKFLERIMRLPNLPRHRPGTKAYEAASKSLEELMAGRLFLTDDKKITKVALDARWCFEFKVDHALLGQAWPEYQVLHVFEDISKLYTPGFEPLDKNTLPRSVTDILYNPRSQKSLFAKVAASGGRPRAASERPAEGRADKLDPLSALVLKILRQAVVKCGRPTCTDAELRHLEKAAVAVLGEYPRVKGLPGGPEAPSVFASMYADWIVAEHEGRLKEVFWLGPGTRDWRAFMRSRGFEG